MTQWNSRCFDCTGTGRWQPSDRAHALCPILAQPKECISPWLYLAMSTTLCPRPHCYCHSTRPLHSSQLQRRRCKLHSLLLLSITQSTANKDSQVHDTARYAWGTVTWMAKRVVYQIICADEKLELNDCGSTTTIDPKTAHSVWTSPDFPTTFHRPHVEQGRLIVCMECSLQDSSVSLF